MQLAAPEFELLLLLVRNRGRVVDKKEIMEAVWPDVEVEENNLTVRMCSLRRALGEQKGHHPYIQTVTGRGYCLIAQVKELPARRGTETAVAATHAGTGSSVPSQSTTAPGIEEHDPLAATERKWEIKGSRLYALSLAGLLAVSLLYAVLRRPTAHELEGSTQSMKMSRVTQTGRVAYASISPDGQNIAYVERNGALHSLWLLRAGTNNPLQLLAPAKLTYKDPTFSRDGNTLYYSKCQPNCQLNRMPVFGGVEITLPVRADSPVTFSPDGKRMAYMRVSAVGTEIDVSLIVANPDGTGEVTLNSRRGGTVYQGGAPAWSPDGKVIAYYRMDMQERERREFVFIPAAGGAPVKTLPAPKNFGSVMRWAASDSLTYRDNYATGLWRLPLDGAKPTPLLNLNGEQLFSFCYSQDARWLAYASGPMLSDVILMTKFK